MELAIEILDKTHVRKDFECGNPVLDNYIRTQAGQDVKRNLSVCYVLAYVVSRVTVGYYTLSSHSIKLEELPEDLRKKLPPSYKAIPTALLGRLAVSSKHQGKKFGELLLLNALNRCAGLSEKIGTLAVIVDPIDENAARFYSAYGFMQLPGSVRMFITMSTIKASKQR